MRSLAIDSSSDLLSVALAEDNKIVVSESVLMQRGQGEALIPLIRKLCESVSWDVASLNQVIVAVGPGSFTGVRIALAAARGIGLSLNIPVYGLTNFSTLIPTDVSYPICVALDTKRGDFYTQIFETATQTTEPCVLSMGDVQSLSMPVITDKPALFDDTVTIIKAVENPAENMIQIADAHPETLLPPEPVYLREADVTVVPKSCVAGK